MENINLVSSINKKESTGILGPGLKSILAVVAFFVLAYLILLAYGYYLDRSLAKTEEEYQAKRIDFVSQNVKDVLDLQNRITLSNNLLNQQRNLQTDLKEIEKLIIPGAYLNSYAYDNEKKIIIVNCYADNFEVVSKQILSFKNSNYFTIVTSGESKLDGKISKVLFPVTLKVIN